MISLNLSDAALKVYNETKEFERVFGIVVPTMFGLIILVGLIGNILVILVVLKNRQMQNSTNILIFSLAVSDLMFIVFCVPFTAADYALPVWVFSRVWCKIVTYLQQVAAYATVWTLVLMALDRFLAVVLPVPSLTLRTCRKTGIVVLCVWFICVVSNIPLLFETDLFEYMFFSEARSVCAFLKSATRNGTEAEVRGLYYSFNAFGYIVPLSITMILYMFMLRKLWFRMPMASKGRRFAAEGNRNKRRVAYMVTIVTITFSVCWLPLNVCFFLTALDYQQFELPRLTKSFVLFQVVAQILAYTNSCLNPILYAFLSENFRRGFYNLLLACVSFRQGGGGTTSRYRAVLLAKLNAGQAPRTTMSLYAPQRKEDQSTTSSTTPRRFSSLEGQPAVKRSIQNGVAEQWKERHSCMLNEEQALELKTLLVPRNTKVHNCKSLTVPT